MRKNMKKFKVQFLHLQEEKDQGQLLEKGRKPWKNHRLENSSYLKGKSQYISLNIMWMISKIHHLKILKMDMKIIYD